MTRPEIGVCLLLAGVWCAAPAAQGDLDAFMRQVLAKRDDNWKKLQQYVLDERETLEVRGPARTSLWGERRDYTWYIRDGFFVRSPVKVNGAVVSDADRQRYEATFLQRERRRERRAKDEPGDRGPAVTATPSVGDAPRDLDGLIKQTQQPQFISSAYFLRFKFDEGRYALVGRERMEDRDVLRIEYYPTKLFTEESRREAIRERALDGQRARERNPRPEVDQQLMSLMNKTSKVTLWIDPTLQQILKYTFDDLGWNFFPGQWLVRVTNATASMTMGQAFPNVWLPRGLEMDVALTLAIGPVDFHYGLDYHDYRQPDVSSRVVVPGRQAAPTPRDPGKR
jgi:hypothetical protein